MFKESNDVENLELEGNWNQEVWSLRTAHKVKMLIWKALRGALLVGTRLPDRHIKVDSRCKRCGEPESITHLFFQCEFAKAMWQAAPFMGEIDFRGIVDLREMWNQVKTRPCLPRTGISSNHLTSWIMWGLWKTRNKLVFSNITLDAEESMSKVIVMARKWQEKQVKPIRVHRTCKPQTLNNANIVLRSDAAWSVTSSRAGLGWVLTQSDNTESFSKVEENIPTPLMAEGMALREALQSCYRRGIKKLRVESDSKILINSVLEGNSVPELYGVVADILLVSSLLDSLCFKWIAREENFATNLLAKQVMGVSEEFMTST